MCEWRRRPAPGQGQAASDAWPTSLRSRWASRDGGAPNSRAYSRLNCEALS